MTRLELITNISKLVQHEITNCLDYAENQYTTNIIIKLAAVVSNVFDDAKQQARDLDDNMDKSNRGIDLSDHKQSSCKFNWAEANDELSGTADSLKFRVKYLEAKVNMLIAEVFGPNPNWITPNDRSNDQKPLNKTNSTNS